MLTSLSLARARFSGSHPEARCLCLAESSSSESQPSVGPGGCLGQRRRMLRFSLRKRWHKKQSKPGEVSASIELPGLSGETQQQPEQQPQGRPSRWKERWRRFRRRFRRREEAEEARREEAEEASGREDASAGVSLPDVSLPGVTKLVQEGQFREACLSIMSSAQDGQDLSSQYQAVAQSMWQVVHQALEGVRHSKELKRKLQSVRDATEWARDTLQVAEDGALRGSGVAAWGRQLEELLRNDAEARMPTWDPKNQLGPYLEDLDKAVVQRLGPPGAGRLGPLECVYAACFQEVLLSRLSEVLPCLHWESCYRLYTWGRTALFGQRGETLLDAPGPSQKPEAENLLNRMVFVTWMSQVQKTLVDLTEEVLKEHLEKVLVCEWKNWGTSPYHTFLDLFQLLEETINSVQDIGPPVTSQVQAMVLKRFLQFLERYQAEATRLLRSRNAGTFSGMHVLRNCHILRETWQELSEEYGAAASLGQAVQDTIDVIEDHSRYHLLSRVRALCQSLLRDHFGKKDKNLVQALQSLKQVLEDWSHLRPAALFESLRKSLYMVIFGEYVQALVSHLRMWKPRKWEDLRDQVDTDTRSLHEVFGKHAGPGLVELRESIMELFLPGKVRGSQTLDSWLASLRDRFPGFLRRDKRHGCEVLEEEGEVKRQLCRCCC